MFLSTCVKTNTHIMFNTQIGNYARIGSSVVKSPNKSQRSPM